MSVDNYLRTTHMYNDDVNRWFKEDYIKRNNLHFVQSRYAYDYCVNELKISDDRVFYLTDYIDEIYTVSYSAKIPRNDYVFYNPAKSFEEQK